MINKYLANAAQDWAGTLAVGIANRSNNSTASATDKFLDYEIGRYSVALKSYSTVSGSNTIVLKATIDPLISASIVEIGSFPSAIIYKDDFAFSDFSEQFSGSSAWIQSSGNAASLTTNSRFGGSNVFVTSSKTWIANNNFSVDMSVYGTNDYASILTYVPSATSASFKLIMSDTLGNQWSSSVASVSMSSQGWWAVPIFLGQNVSSAFNYVLSSLSVVYGATTTASIQFDALKFYSGDTPSPETQLTSRTVFTTPIAKAANQPMQLE